MRDSQVKSWNLESIIKQPYHDDKAKLMNFISFEYIESKEKYCLHFECTTEEVNVYAQACVKTTTLIKWYEKHNGTKIELIRECRRMFSMSQYTVQNEFRQMAIPLEPAKQLVEEFIERYEGLLGIT